MSVTLPSSAQKVLLLLLLENSIQANPSDQSNNLSMELAKFDLAILAALQITDELFRERAAVELLTSDIRQLASDIRPLLPPAKRGEDGSPV